MLGLFSARSSEKLSLYIKVVLKCFKEIISVGECPCSYVSNAGEGDFQDYMMR